MIAIKEMEMPRNCLDCPVRNYRDDEGNRCDLTGLYNREDCCPLIEIVTCKDCEHCRFELVEGMPYYWCDKDDRVTSEDYYCADGERRE